MLKKGDEIALIAPSGFFYKKDLKNGIAFLKSLGFKPKVMPHAYDIFYYAAGTPQNRAKDINDAFKNKKIKALFCIRGGAGSSHVLDYLDYDLIKKNKKPVFGLSDSTALQNALYTKSKNISYTGFLPIYDLKEGTLNPTLKKSLNSVISSEKTTYKKFNVINKGVMEGVVVGGCLSVFTLLCGTPYFPNLKNKILLIEDVGEKTYRIDLMLEQLRQQRNFDQIQGIIFGSFLNCLPADEEDGTVDDVIFNFASKVNKPVIYNFPYGHTKERVLLPIGKKIKIQA